MAHAQFATAIQFVSRFLRSGPELTDGQLVEGFIGRRDEGAFTALVQRHGPMVLGVCRQVLRDHAAAEDAFQATFLVLARKAGSIRRGQAVGSWLYQVAHRVALRARTQEDQRHLRERETAMMRPTQAVAQPVEQDLAPVLHEEVRRLPEKYQAPVVLCYLEGKTAAQAAAQLGWRETVVRGRLFQAKTVLRDRLRRRGIALSASGLGTALAGQTAVAVPPALAAHTVHAALAFGTGVTATGFSGPVIALAESAAAGLTRSRLGFMAGLCLLVGTIGATASVLALAAPAGSAPVAGVSCAWAQAAALNGGAADARDLIQLAVNARGSVTPADRKEPFTDQAELVAYLKEQHRKAAEAAAKQGDAAAKVQTVVRVTVHMDADFGPVYAVLSVARKAGFARLDLQPLAKPVDLEPKENALTVLVKALRDGVNDGALAAVVVGTADGESAVPSLEALGKFLKELRKTAALKDDLNVAAESHLHYRSFREVVETCQQAGFARVHLTLPPDLAVDPAEPPFEDRPIEATAKTPRPEGTDALAKATAVNAGLAWLAEHQAADGSWTLHAFHRDGKCNCTATGAQSPIAGVAFGLLPFLRAGQTHEKGTHVKQVERGLKFVITQQAKDGSFGKKQNMYEHGLATMALCEAYARTGDAQLKEPAQRAVNYIVAAQHEAGGWRYVPRIPGDLSVTGWQIQALRWGHLAGLDIPDATWKKANAYLDTVSNPEGSGYGYMQPSPAPTMTACGLLCRTYLLDDFLGAEPTLVPGLAKGAGYLAKLPPSPNFRNLYYYYYATTFMNQDVVPGADEWNTALRRVLIAAQDWGEDAKHQHHKGSWNPEGDAWGGQLGRLGMTSFALMTLSASDPFYPRVKEAAKDLQAGEVEKLWGDLSGGNGPARVGQATRTLAAARQTVPFLKQQLRPVATADPKLTARLVADLDNQDFPTRERATTELEKLGESATTALRRALDDKPPLEVRQRVEALLNRLQSLPVSAEERQRLRAVRVLEQIGTPEAREVLQTLAGGAAGARLTRTARVALDRLPTK